MSRRAIDWLKISFDRHHSLDAVSPSACTNASYLLIYCIIQKKFSATHILLHWKFLQILHPSENFHRTKITRYTVLYYKYKWTPPKKNKNKTNRIDMLCAKHGFAQSMDCAAQSSDLHKIWIGLSKNVVKIASHLSHPSSFP